MDKNILSSAHINFLFGAGVNGAALPQLKKFDHTKDELKKYGADISEGIEAGIDQLNSANERDEIKKIFINEFREFYGKVVKPEEWNNNQSLKNLSSLMRKVYMIVREAQNRNPSMKQINIYTLNYDDIVERILAQLGYFFVSLSASNNSTRSSLVDVIGFDYKTRKYIPSFMVSKLHGDIDQPIIPGKQKYRELLTPDYFEVAFNMKEQLCRQNSMLIVIGYSGRDEHINEILSDCINAGLMVYWYKYSPNDYVPFEEKNQVIIREPEEKLVDTTLTCLTELEEIWDERSEES